MAFVVKQSDCYRCAITVHLVAENGKKVSNQFEAKFRRISTTRVEEIVEIAKRVKDDGDLAELRLNDLLFEIIADWDGVESEPGKPLPFSQEALDSLLDIPSVGAQILEAWFNSINHQKTKN